MGCSVRGSCSLPPLPGCSVPCASLSVCGRPLTEWAEHLTPPYCTLRRAQWEGVAEELLWRQKLEPLAWVEPQDRCLLKGETPPKTSKSTQRTTHWDWKRLKVGCRSNMQRSGIAILAQQSRWPRIARHKCGNGPRTLLIDPQKRKQQLRGHLLTL